MVEHKVQVALVTVLDLTRRERMLLVRVPGLGGGDAGMDAVDPAMDAVDAAVHAHVERTRPGWLVEGVVYRWVEELVGNAGG